MSFSKAIEKFRKESIGEINTVRRGVIVKLFGSIIQSTPVDTGLLRANWQTTAGKAAVGVLKSKDKSGASTTGKISGKIGKGDNVVFFTNNLPYAHVVEFGEYPKSPKKGVKTSGGFSKQAPKGMVRLNVMRFQQILKEEVGKL